MSIDTCKCGTFIDTDYDPDGYEFITEDCETIELGHVVCYACKAELMCLLEAKEQTDNYRSVMFEYVRMLNDLPLLDRLSDVSKDINERVIKIAPELGEKND